MVLQRVDLRRHRIEQSRARDGFGYIDDRRLAIKFTKTEILLFPTPAAHGPSQRVHGRSRNDHAPPAQWIRHLAIRRRRIHQAQDRCLHHVFGFFRVVPPRLGHRPATMPVDGRSGADGR